MASVVVVDSGREVLAVRLRKLRLLVQEGEDAGALCLDQVDAVLVVHEVHVLHPETFLLVQLLLVLEDPLVEELLQFLVHKVDGDLLEAVVLEDLEAGDVENSDEVGLLQGGVDESVVTLRRKSIICPLVVV